MSQMAWKGVMYEVLRGVIYEVLIQDVMIPNSLQHEGFYSTREKAWKALEGKHGTIQLRKVS